MAAPIDDKAWLIDTHGTDSVLTGTARAADFGLVAGDVLPGGTPVVYDAATKTYKSVFGEDAEGATQVAATGHVRESVLVGAGTSIGIAVQWHGVAAAELIPTPEGVEFDAELGAPHFLYR
ncbi:hypothetical protein ASF35_16250 [Aeromicrobium sp. Leaf291]|nr:hypothetical protein ASF35_16250 [Aeromicrobium sp. Leaf291]